MEDPSYELVDARQRVEEEVRLDLRLQRLHPRFQKAALELLGVRPQDGLARGKFRASLAPRHDLDNDRGDDEEERSGVGSFNMPPPRIMASNRTSSSAFQETSGHPIEKSPPHHDDALADLAEGLG